MRAQIRFILLQNRQGRTRLAKYYVPLDDQEKRKLEVDIHRLVVNRDPKNTNFLEVCLPLRPSRPARASACRRPPQRRGPCAGWQATLSMCVPWVQFRTHKVIYRRYAGLFFSMCVDVGGACPRARPAGLLCTERSVLRVPENELACLEAIHLFVEVLDTYFEHVCELDLVWHFHKVYMILDEFILGGEIQETSKKVILERMEELEKLEAQESGGILERLT